MGDQEREGLGARGWAGVGRALGIPTPERKTCQKTQQDQPEQVMTLEAHCYETSQLLNHKNVVYTITKTLCGRHKTFGARVWTVHRH